MKWALIDVSWLAHRARYTLGKMGLTHDQMDTGIIFGFFEQLRTVCADWRIASNQVGLFFDSRHSYRRDAFPTYKLKEHDERTPEEIAELVSMKQQVRRLRHEILPAIGFPTYRQNGVESDDLIAKAAEENCLIAEAVIVTADGDLYQCISPSVHWFDPQRNVYHDPHTFIREKGISADQWADVKCLAGCKSDVVPGIVGIGETTAIQYLTGMMNPEHKRYQAIACKRGRDVRARNEELVRLPHPKTRSVPLVRPVYDPKAFYGWAARLGFDSYLDGSRRRDWDRFFDGEMRAGRQTTRRPGEVKGA